MDSSNRSIDAQHMLVTISNMYLNHIINVKIINSSKYCQFSRMILKKFKCRLTDIVILSRVLVVDM